MDSETKWTPPPMYGDGGPPPEEPPPPMAEALESKNWRHRKHGYEELADKLEKAAPSDALFKTYAPNLATYSKDNNAAAQAAALKTCLIFLQNMDAKQDGGVLSGDTGVEMMRNVVDKGFGGRPANKALAIQIVVECGGCGLGQTAVSVVVSKGFGHKLPKIKLPSLESMVAAFKAYGPKVFPPGPVLKGMGEKGLFEDKDAKVRKATLECVGEMVRWMGSGLEGILPELKDAQKVEVDKVIANVKQGATAEKVPRYMGADTAAASSTGGENDGETVGDAGGGDDNAMLMDMVDPVNVLAQLNREWWKKLEEKDPKQGWKKRKEALDELLVLLKAPKLAKGDYSSLAARLTKLFKDANVLVIGAAIKCLTKLAAGLREDFTRYALTALPGLIDQFKEKKPQVSKPVNEALDTFLSNCFTLGEERVCTEIKKGVLHKVIKVKTDSLALLQRSIPRQDPKNVTQCVHALAPTLLMLLDDADGSVRNGAGLVLGAMKDTAPEGTLDRHLDGLDESKAKKLKGGDDGGRGQSASRSSRGGVGVKGREGAAGGRKPSASPRKPAESGTAAAGRGTSSGQRGRGRKGARESRGSGSSSSGKTKAVGGMSADEAANKAEEIFDADLREGLAAGDWKTRLEAVDKIKAMVESGGVDANIAGPVVVAMLQTAGRFKDTNFQVSSRALETGGAAVSKTAQTGGSGIKVAAAQVTTAIVEKFGDLKVRKAGVPVLLDLMVDVGTKPVLNALTKAASGHKSPKVLEEALLWAQGAVEVFGAKVMGVKTCVDFAKDSLKSNNPKVKDAALKLLGTLHAYTKGAVGTMLRDLTDAQVANVERNAEGLESKDPVMFVRSDGEKGEPGSNAAASGGGSGGGDADGSRSGGGDIGSIDKDELYGERVDVSNKLTPSLLGKIKEREWRVRLEMLGDVEAILDSANRHVVCPKMAGVINAMKTALGDAQKQIIEKALTVIGTLVESVGEGGAPKLATNLLEAVTELLGHRTPSVRNKVIVCLGEFHKVMPPKDMVKHIGRALGAKNVDGRTAVLNHANSIYGEGKPGAEADLTPLADPLITCLLDRQVEVKKLAQTLLVAVVASIGERKLSAIVQRRQLKPTQKSDMDKLIAAAIESNALSKAEKARADKVASKAANDTDPGSQGDGEGSGDGDGGSGESRGVSFAPPPSQAAAKQTSSTSPSNDDSSSPSNMARAEKLADPVGTDLSGYDSARSSIASARSGSATGSLPTMTARPTDADSAKSFTEQIRDRAPDEQADIVLERLEHNIPSEDRVTLLRHLGTLLSGTQATFFDAVGLVDGIVERLVSQLQTAFAQQPFDARLCKYLIFTIMTIMEGPLAKNLTVDVCMHELIVLTIVHGRDTTDQVVLLVRAINATVVSFADNADPTITLSFMIRLLHSPPMDEEMASDQDLLDRYQKVTTRMMVKMVKKLPVLLPVIDLEQIFVEIDRFLYLYSSDSDSDVMDLPNRIIKTIVHAVVKYKGRQTNDILRNIAHITGDAEDSTLVHLVSILLQSIEDDGGRPSAGQASVTSSATPTIEARPSRPSPPRQPAAPGSAQARLDMLRQRVDHVNRTSDGGNNPTGDSMEAEGDTGQAQPQSISDLRRRLAQLRSTSHGDGLNNH